jgi:ATP-binding cassette subfamily B (MDR/TAP) protein 1
LPGGLDYNVGYAGSQLSGGQKQRLAIARAILRNPQILILDEATSALDRRNEKLIQKTLDKLSNGVTTLTIAHRIKTIMNANKIFVLNSGVVE